MLSYRHHFHAGNFADVHKHFLLVHCLDYFNRKPKPYLYLDTHGGTGLYDTTAADAAKNHEADFGIYALEALANPPEAITRFMTAIRAIAQAPLYPGSPLIAAALLRRNDSLRTCELHPTDYPLLVSNLKQLRPHHSIIHPADGYAEIAAALPPPQHRALILIDPSYEEKQDYQRVIRAIEQAIKRFRQACILIWYPQLSRLEAQEQPKHLIHTAEKFDLDWLNSQITVKAPNADGFGMYGSGMFIINPPYLLPHLLKEAESALLSALARDSAARHNLNYRIR